MNQPVCVLVSDMILSCVIESNVLNTWQTTGEWYLWQSSWVSPDIGTAWHVLEVGKWVKMNGSWPVDRDLSPVWGVVLCCQMSPSHRPNSPTDLIQLWWAEQFFYSLNRSASEWRNVTVHTCSLLPIYSRQKGHLVQVQGKSHPFPQSSLPTRKCLHWVVYLFLCLCISQTVSFLGCLFPICCLAQVFSCQVCHSPILPLPWVIA